MAISWRAAAKRRRPPIRSGTACGSAPQPPTPFATPSQTVQQLINRAIQEFDDYQRLVSQGKFAEAGQKLEQHKRTLDEIRRLSQ